MVQDIAYEQLSIPAVLSTVYLNLISTQIKNKVHFDILHIKPIEFAQSCTVPCVFIIGKEDKLVLPKRVTQIFEAYKGKQKQILSSGGQHSSEREPHIIRQCQDFILQELRKNAINNRQSVDRRERFLDSVSGGVMQKMAGVFEDKFRANFGRHFTSHRVSNYAFGMKYNFDTFLDESRNEERSFAQHGSQANLDLEYKNEHGFGHGQSASTASSQNLSVEITEEEFQQYVRKMEELMKKEKI